VSRCRRAWAAAAALLLAACASHPAGGPAAAAGDAGYLAAGARPDGLALVPPPPAPGSPAAAHDREAMRAALALQGTPRFARARHDADLRFPGAAGIFDCALGVAVDPDAMPATVRLLRRSLVDAAGATRAAKERYRRPRPFLENGAPTCTPEEEPALRGSGAYPSGHAAVGWTWALALASAVPARAEAVLARGRDYGYSRQACNVHWHSDVEQGQLLGTATFVRLLADPAFRADLEAAAAELDAARAAGAAAPPGCASGEPAPAAR